jgi:hypothetical protein
MTKSVSDSTSEYFSEVCHCSRCVALREKHKKTKKIKAKGKK